MRFLPVEKIIKGNSKATEKGIFPDPEPDQAVEPVVGVGIGADDHAAATIGSGLAPVSETACIVDLPALYSVDFFFRTVGDGLGGTNHCAFLAVPAEINHSRIGCQRWHHFVT